MLRFVQRQTDITQDSITRLSHETGMDAGLCRLLCMRGITDKNAAEDFLTPSFSNLLSPFLFRDMEKARERIERAFQTHEKVCIFGDYDVDGVCATAILYSYLKYRGMNVSYYIPSRHSEGYGMHTSSVELLSEQGVSLIITVDNGIAAHSEIARAYELGMQVIVTDHHKCPGAPPVCEAVLCHTVENETYPNKNICGAGTALKLVHALGGDEAARAYLPYAGLATVADIVPLTGENRVITSLAIEAINSDNCPIGLKALIDVATKHKKVRISDYHFAFFIAPRLNAAGRMDTADLSMELMCETDYDRAHDTAEKLDELNTIRRTDEKRIFDEAEEQIRSLQLADTRIIILKSDTWNPGIVGLAANKIVDKYNRPCILFAERDGTLTGSARSISGVNIYDVMNAFADTYERFGGHALAAGLTMRAERFDEYREKVNEYVIAHYPFTVFIPSQVYDYEAQLSDVTLKTAQIMEKIAPFGEGNPEPLLLLRGAKIMHLQRVGQELSHLNGRVMHGNVSCSFAAFSKGYMFDELMGADTCDVLFTPSVNTWRGESSLQLLVKAFAPSRIADADGFFGRRKEEFTASFGKNLHLQSEDKFVPSYIGTDILMRTLKTSCEGTLLLCTDAESAGELTRIIQDNSCFCDITLTVPHDNAMCHNTLCAAPDIRRIAAMNTGHFRIVLCGVISTRQAAAVRELFPDAEILMYKTEADESDVNTFYEACARQNMGAVYSCMNGQIKGKSLFSDGLVQNTSKQLSLSPAICQFSLDIFTELGLFLKDKGDRISANISDRKATLSDSVLYRAAQGFRDDIIRQ